MTPLVGQDDALTQFTAAASGGALHHAWLIAGPEGTGKGTFARDAALRLLAQSLDLGDLPPGLAVPPSNPAAALMAAGSHPDFRLLERQPADAKERAKPKDERDENARLARNIGIDQVRALGPLFALAPSLSRRRVILIDSIDDLERAAANALLKHLEEPPAGTIFLLVSHAPGRLLPTIRSRCRVLRFRPLADTTLADVLSGLLPPATSPAEIAALVRVGKGSVGRALAHAGLDIGAIEDQLRRIATDGDPTNVGRVALGRMISAKSQQPRYEAFLDHVPGFIAGQALGRSGQALADALAAWEAARDIAAGALALNVDPAVAAFELGSQVARLAPLQNGAAMR